jgi:pilus assembly protein CpaE
VYPLSAGVVVETKEIWDELMRSLQDLSIRVVLELPEVPSDWSSFLERLDRVRPDVILLDVTHLREPLDQVVRRIRTVVAPPAVFALHTTTESTVILDAMRAGASEFLCPPFHDALKAALERLGQAKELSRTTRRSARRTLGFVSAKGGCGATTLACHVAAELPRQVNTKVLLADLDLQSGLIGFLTKTKSPYSLADAVNNIMRLDLSYWRALVSNGIPNLEIIAAPAEPDSKELSAAQIKQVLAFARTVYPWLVLDLGRNLNAFTLGVLEQIDELYLVTTHEVPALHQAKQMIRFLLDDGYPQANIRLVLNRIPKRPDVTSEELEQMLGVPVFASLANEYHTLQEAYAEGRMVDSGTNLGQGFTRLTAKISGVPETQKKKKFSLFG